MTIAPAVNVDIQALLELPSDQLNDIIDQVRKQTRVKEEERMREAVASHVELVGKCFKRRVKPRSGMFPPMTRYYKIISARADNEYRVSALVFDEYPTYWFDYHSSKIGRPGDYYFGHYDFDGIHVVDFPFYCNNLLGEEDDEGIIRGTVGDTLTEITLEEYNAAMDLYIDRLQEMDWPPDHYRWGNKKPGDPDWEKEPNEYC